MRHLRATPICKAVKIFSRSAPGIEEVSRLAPYSLIVQVEDSSLYIYIPFCVAVLARCSSVMFLIAKVAAVVNVAD